jgi:hypothetical protein
MLFLATGFALAQNTNVSKFKQLGQELPTPNVYRTGSGAPGHLYWQQKVDYQMSIRLDDANQRIYGDEVITYTNNSPDVLTYLWVQLDQNVRAQNSMTSLINTTDMSNGVNIWQYKRMHNNFPGGFNLDYVKDAKGQDMDATINYTMMRINLEKPLNPGESTVVKIKWWYNINDRMQIGGRSGYEYFEEDKNYLYTIAQFFPRMAVYSDVEGWQNKQFLGRGEFALPFGDYDVKITVPSDMPVAATGEVQNPQDVLTKTQLSRLEEAKTSEKPVLIITQDEATKNESSRSKTTKTWHFKAENVRDFGWAASRKFIWDAQGVQFGDRTVMAMSMYPKEGNPMWEMYSTKAVVLTLKTYSKYTFDYPYPVAYSINGKSIGMEYPMICFNGGRTDAEGNFTDAVKYRTILVIIHEVGHNYFPMIVNSDERQWTWMDEGLNTFCQYLTEKEWSDETGKPFPSRRGPPDNIIPYMKGDKRYISPIMTNSESIWQFGSNAYGKPATALNILRETVMGPELFDYAFKEYANRWKFKHPSPADFFRTMEDASAVDLDWFWRGWFYTNDHCDLSLDRVIEYQVKLNPIEGKFNRKKDQKIRDKAIKKGRTVYFDPIRDGIPQRANSSEIYKRAWENLGDERKNLEEDDDYYYQLDLSNVGGLVMPVILEFHFVDGSKKEVRIPAEIWKLQDQVSKVFVFDKKVKQIILDPHKEIADVEKSNNYWPKDVVPEVFK